MSSKKIFLAASILSANFAQLGQETKNVLKAGIDAIHFDVMDHHYVPNLSFGAIVCDALRKAGITAPIDVHLMVTNPELYIAPFAKAGANRLTFHSDTVNDVSSICKKIIDAGMKPGLAFNPDQAITIAHNILPLLDLILLMSVFPGFGGQKFMPETLEKIRLTKKLVQNHRLSIQIGIDGGIKVDNMHAVTQAGADFIVIGSGLFNTDDYQARVAELRSQQFVTD